MFGPRLKKLRTTKKLTQKQLAEHIKVTHVSISGYENGNRYPDTDTLQRLADYFEVTTDYLLGRDDNYQKEYFVSHIKALQINQIRNEKRIKSSDMRRRLNMSDQEFADFSHGNVFITEEQAQIIELETGIPKNQLKSIGHEKKLTSDEEFEAFANNPDLERWYKDLPNSDEEDLEALKQMWEIIKKNR